jgi:hypothetical protein
MGMYVGINGMPQAEFRLMRHSLVSLVGKEYGSERSLWTQQADILEELQNAPTGVTSS